MNGKLIVLLTTCLLPAYASAGKLDLQQDLGGLDLTVVMQPPDSPKTIRISNKTSKVAACIAYFTGADYGGTKSATIQPGKSITVRVPAAHTDKARSAELMCGEKRPAAK